MDDICKKKSLCDLKKDMGEILKKYQKAKIQIECYETIDKLSTTHVKEKEELIMYVNFIEKVLNLLNDKTNEFIKNEFLTRNVNHSWWKDKYTQNEYYKIRSEAIQNFLSYAT